jgi:hypothetical protein
MVTKIGRSLQFKPDYSRIKRGAFEITHHRSLGTDGGHKPTDLAHPQSLRVIHRLAIRRHEVDIHPRTNDDSARFQRRPINRHALLRRRGSLKASSLRGTLDELLGLSACRLLRAPGVGNIRGAVLDLDGDDLTPHDSRVVLGLLHGVLHGVNAGLAAYGGVGGICSIGSQFSENNARSFIQAQRGSGHGAAVAFKT